MSKLFTLECRSTGRGAYTTMYGEKYNVSRTGHHWMERYHVEPGQRLHVVDITNTGKHCCFILMLRNGKFEQYHAVGRDGRCWVCEDGRLDEGNEDFIY